MFFKQFFFSFPSSFLYFKKGKHHIYLKVADSWKEKKKKKPSCQTVSQLISLSPADSSVNASLVPFSTITPFKHHDYKGQTKVTQKWERGANKQTKIKNSCLPELGNRWPSSREHWSAEGTKYWVLRGPKEPPGALKVPGVPQQSLEHLSVTPPKSRHRARIHWIVGKTKA